MDEQLAEPTYEDTSIAETKLFESHAVTLG